MNVLALADDRVPRRDVEIPTGLQNSPAPGSGAGGSGGASKSGASAEGVSRSSGAGVRLPPVLGAEAAMPVPPQSVKGDPPAEVTRMDHPPNGSFDVVITQSAARDDERPSGARLSGAPVYTVYLPVGDKREWLLEFCASNVASGPASPYQIDIPDQGILAPPYPISTVIPAKISSERRSAPVVLQGALTAAGTMRGFRAVGATGLYGAALLQMLNEWRFRPAVRNRKAVEVEILLIIPPTL